MSGLCSPTKRLMRFGPSKSSSPTELKLTQSRHEHERISAQEYVPLPTHGIAPLECIGVSSQSGAGAGAEHKKSCTEEENSSTEPNLRGDVCRAPTPEGNSDKEVAGLELDAFMPLKAFPFR